MRDRSTGRVCHVARKKKKIGPPGSYVPKPMWVVDPIWPGLSHLAYKSAEEIALASGAAPYPYKLSALPVVRAAKLPKYTLTKSPKRTRGGPNASD